MPEAAIVILNWNGVDFLKEFLPSVVEYSEGTKIIVIDNASSDTSVAFLATAYPFIETIVLDKNYGFAEGYNRGLAQIKASYYILLNSDVAVTENWWQSLIAVLQSDDKIAAVQPKILSFHDKESFEYAGACGGYLDKYGYPFCRGRILDTLEKDRGQYNNLQQVFWTSGAAMAVKADIFHKLGGFDADFFAHMEEIDLCWRMQRANYTLYCEPNSVVYHVGGGTLPNESPFKLYLNFRNNLCMLYKNLPNNELFRVFFFRAVLDGMAALKYLLSGNWKAFKSVFKAYHAFVRSLGRLKLQRKALMAAEKIVAKRYQKSMLWQYFFLRNRQFSEIETGQKIEK